MRCIEVIGVFPLVMRSWLVSYFTDCITVSS